MRISNILLAELAGRISIRASGSIQSYYSILVCLYKMSDTRDFCRSSHASTLGVNLDAIGDVEQYDQLSGDFLGLLHSHDHFDVTFKVEGQLFHAHRVLLAARCKYFDVMLYGSMKEALDAEKGECIEIPDTTASAFQVLLEYIYTGKVLLSDLSEQVVLEVLELVNKYNFTSLLHPLSCYLKATLTVTNVCHIFEIANVYSLHELLTTSCTLMDLNAKEVLNTEGFLTLSEPSLNELLSRDSFYADEVDIFNGVIEWLQFNGKTKDDSQRVLTTVRLNLLNMKELLSRVRPSGFFCPDTILDAIEAKVNVDPLTLNRRGILIPDDNVARLQHAAEVIEGQQTQCLLDGNSENYNWDHGFTLHRIDPDKPEGITIKLGRPHIINTIRMLLFDRDYRSYSYVIQVSLDQEKWLKVVEYSNYYCRSWQELHFQARVVQYIRVIGTMNTHNRSFHLVAFECLYSTRPFVLSPLYNGLIVPTDNVASVAASATVIEGVSRSRNALLNGNIRDYDWDSGYTCHQLGSGSIVIQLAQPYVIDSMRLLLWDCDERIYKYTISVSVDNQNWTTVVDKSREICKSWQSLRFDPVPVVFIKIVGTYNSNNEVFHCVHFECPDVIKRESLSHTGENYSDS